MNRFLQTPIKLPNSMRNLSLLVILLFGLCGNVFSQNEYATGCLFDKEKYESVPASAQLMSRDYNSVPSSYSLKKYTPYPKSQGSQGSCTGWSSTYAARTIAYAIRNNLTDRAKITIWHFRLPTPTIKQN